MYARYIKRILDIILSALGMIALSPFMLLIALAVWAENHSSPIFTQKRFGRDRKMIYIRKFKTMRDDAPHDVPTDQINAVIEGVKSKLDLSNLDVGEAAGGIIGKIKGLFGGNK